MDASDLRHAYAVLDLSPPVTEARLKRRYKTLVRHWHPDRFQADPLGQKEATTRLRDINIAYELVAASLESADPSPVAPPADAADQPFSWSPERVNEMVDSINRLNGWSLLPEMSVHRWLSVGAVVIYLVYAGALLRADLGLIRAMVRAVVVASFYLWIPLYLIWRGDNDTLSSPERLFFRIIGWLFMAVPAVVGIALWMG